MFNRPAAILAILSIAGSAMPAMAGSAGLGDGELLWPEDPRSIARLALEHALSAESPSPSAWPRTRGEICAPARDLVSPPGAEAAPQALQALRRACAESPEDPNPATVVLHAGAYAVGKTRPLGAPFEHFDGRWYSLRSDPEQALAWSHIPPAARVELRHGFSPRAFAFFRMGLRRDMSAWRADDLAFNLPQGSREVDMNEPSLGYFSYRGGQASLTVGRFPTQWSPTPEMGLTLSGSAPYHDGLEAAFRMGRLTYRVLVSSLNPWLEGTPPGGSAGTDYPVGSEEWRQRNYPDTGNARNGHKRVYDARAKTLLAHRLETRAGPLEVGITESQIVGGKVPDLRDLNPFAVFHNDFRDGYTNTNVAVDARLRLPFGLLLAAEVFLDDLQYGETERKGTSENLLGWLGALSHAFRAGPWAFRQSVHAVRTDPYLYGFLQPLNTYAARRVLTSNGGDTRDEVYYDKLVVDHPIGYLRGGDALDLWYRIQALRGPYAVSLGAARLTRGQAGLAAPYQGVYAPHGSSPSGVTEKELRLTASGRAAARGGVAFDAGLQWSLFDNFGHVEGEEGRVLRVSAGVSWTFPR